MAELTRGERLQIMLTPEELEALDTWRFAARMPSRAAAIRELLKRGLIAQGFAKADATMKSGDFGVGPRTERGGIGDLNSKGDGRPKK
jgi:hypothetical protein